jgi:hypothetical protein
VLACDRAVAILFTVTFSVPAVAEVLAVETRTPAVEDEAEFCPPRSAEVSACAAVVKVTSDAFSD